ncbi:Uma2 family endonuclease [Desulfobacterales bacterium HSG2]|nr:Uma2 family endonuclease [Desulfobacterales bacterium HSG2]
MDETLPKEIIAEELDFSQIVTEDDEPVDSLFSEKQQRLLVGSLYSSWEPGRLFMATANVGIFYGSEPSVVVPDTLVSLDVEVADDMWSKRNRSYFLSVFGKPPEVVVEIVSSSKGGETGEDIRKYAQVGIRYYIVFDPQKLVQKDALRIYELSEGQYIRKIDCSLPQAGLGVTLWEGVFEGIHDTWLRWLDHEGKLILAGQELAEKAEKWADEAESRAEETKRRTEDTKRRTEEAKRRVEAEQKRAEKQLISIVQNLLSTGILSPEQISQATGLGLAEVEKLREAMQTDSS